jgi:protein phosphatase
MLLRYPSSALILLVGPSGSGKSTFARRHFGETEVLSSDRCRAMVGDDEKRQDVNEDAFSLLHHWLDLRLKNRRFTVVDSTALKPSARENLLNIAAARRVPCYALALDVPLEECVRRDAARERTVGPGVIEKQYATFTQVKKELAKEKRLAGFTVVPAEDVDAVTVERGGVAKNARQFDVIGDVHGCYLELADLLESLGYRWDARHLPVHPEGRVPAFVGDLADRGPDSPGVLQLVCRLVAADLALFAPGNHDDKLFRLLKGNKVTKSHGLDLTEQQILALPEAERDALTGDVLTLLAPAPPYLVLDGGNLVVAHAGIREEMIGRTDGQVKQFTLYGDVRGFEPDGMPIRYDWASEYAGSALIAYGHTPQTEVRFVGNTINLDGGCVFGGELVALRYPERTLFRVPARAAYAEKAGFGGSEVGGSEVSRP